MAPAAHVNFDDDVTPRQFEFTHWRQKYILHEASEAAAVEFNRARMSGVEIFHPGDGEERTVKSLQGAADVEPLLVSHCVFMVNPDGSEAPVSLQTIKTWPSRIVRNLFQRAKEMSGLDEAETMQGLQDQLYRLQGKIEKLKGAEGAGKNF